MRVGEVAERAGVNVETLRYYERRGLLPEPERLPSGHRRYDEETVLFLRAIKEAQSVGFTLAEIGEYLGAARRSGSPSEALRIRMAAKIDEIDGRIAGLRRMRDELARVVGCACDSLDHCTCGAAYLARRGRAAAAPPALLHVTNGESAGNTLRQTGLGGAVLSWQDVLHEGPVPALPPAELRAVRARFLSECGWGSERSLLNSFERRDRLFEHALEAQTRVVLWFEPDVYDQLQLLEALPDADTGLGRTERQLLEPLLDGSKRPPELYLASQAREEAIFLGDAWAWKRLAELVPLVEELPPPPPLGDPREFAATPVTLTELGRDVLAGKVDRVEVAPVDRWLGGTHLGGERDWRWDGRALLG